MRNLIKSVEPLILIVLLYIVFHSAAFSQDLIINEFSSANLKIIQDEDGDFSDWIELYNRGAHSVDLEGYGLSDDTANLQRWIFPKIILDPGNYLLVWTSGKDRKPEQGEKSIGIQRQVYSGIPGNKVSDLINNSVYPDHPTSENIITDYFEAPTNIADNYGQRLGGLLLAPATGDYTFWIAGDDNSQLFLSTDEKPENAVKIAEVPDWTNSREWSRFPEQKSLPVRLEEGKYYYLYALMKEEVGGDNLAVRWQLPDNTTEEPIPASRIFMRQAELHTNFSLKASGEPIILSDSDGNIIQKIDSLDLLIDLSYGRFPNASDTWERFYLPTPGAPNNDKIFYGQCERPVFSVTEGFYTNSFTISMSCPTPDSKIYYTLDSTEPTETDELYTGPLTINKTTNVRAKAYSPVLQPGPVTTKTYFFNESSQFPVISLTTDPENLYDQETGIFVYWDPYWESNLFQDWERPMNIQFFEQDGTPGFNMDAGVKVHGGLTRATSLKSLALFARSEYGQARFNYKLFPDRDIYSFDNFVLRNSGNDLKWTMFRDCFMQSIIKNRMDLEIAAARPSIVFLNGQYWGIRNIREKINEDFLEANANAKADKVDILEYVHHNDEVIVLEGSGEDFNAMISFIEKNDITGDENYGYVKSKIDIDNFIQYQVAQIYYDNSDWPGNNIKWWRPNDPVGKWRWLLFDTDFGFGLSPFGNETGDELLHYKHNTLQLATETNGEEWPNPPHSTFLFRSLLKNQEFRHKFINTFCDHLNTSFQPARVTAIVDAFQNLYANEIGRHRQAIPLPIASWNSDIQVLRDFAQYRPTYIFIHLMEEFKLVRNKKLTLDVSDPQMGKIRINSLLCNSYPWTGNYFPGVPVTITALPNAGFRFLRWSDGNTSITRKIDINDISLLTAEFAASSFDPLSIVINEINYISSPDLDTEDWVELYNNSEITGDLSNWNFKDDGIDHVYIIPENTFIQPKGYLVLSRDTIRFNSYYSTHLSLVGNLDFGFSSNGELLRLYNESNELIDYVNYEVFLPWPDLVGNPEYTIELTDPYSNNNLGENWKLSGVPGGTPAASNTAVISSGESMPGYEKISKAKSYPNPFSTFTTIEYNVIENGPVSVCILNLTGQVIRTIHNTELSPGRYSCIWDGTNDNGEMVEAGVYLFRIRMKNYHQTSKIIFMH